MIKHRPLIVILYEDRLRVFTTCNVIYTCLVIRLNLSSEKLQTLL
jgi:hypothetical protein